MLMEQYFQRVLLFMFPWSKLVIWSCGWGQPNHQWSEPVVIPFFEVSTHPTPIVFSVWSSQFCFAGVVKVSCESFFQTTGNSKSYWCSCPIACLENVAHSLCVMCTPHPLTTHPPQKKEKAWITSVSFQFQVCFQIPVFMLRSSLFLRTHCFDQF